MDYAAKIREVLDFPKTGIHFMDMTTLWKDPKAFGALLDDMCETLSKREIDLIVSPEARGFVFGAAIAAKLGKGFIPARKPGKLPAETVVCDYRLEYGVNWLQMHKDAIQEGQRVAVIDDLLATGGTVNAACKLVEKLGGIVDCVCVAAELVDLNGAEQIASYECLSFIRL